MPRTPAFVGRDEELGELAALVAALSGSGTTPGLVAVVGEAGIGKTRLLDELVGSVPTGFRMLRGRADELDPAAFGLWAPVLAQLDLPRPGTDPSVPAGEQRWEVVDLLAGALAEVAPALVVLDDLHWADDDSLWVCEQLVDRLAHQPLAFVAATRPSAESRSPRWQALYRRAHVVSLDGLTAAEVAELADQMGADAGDPTTLQERTGGNPLFVREQLLAGSTAVPSSVEALLGTAIGRLGPEAAALLSVLAVGGADVPVDVLGPATGRPVADVEADLAAARHLDLLVEEPTGRRFRHDLLAEVAGARLSPAERAAAHRDLAEAWDATGGPRARLTAARHRVLAAPVVPPMDAATGALAAAAAERAAGRTTDGAALLLLARTRLAALPGVDATTRAHLALAEAEARWELDDFDGATAASEAALAEQADVDRTLAAAIEVVSLQHANPFAPDPVRLVRIAELDESLDEVAGVDPALRIRLRGRRAFLSMVQPGGIDEAVTLGDDVVRRARELGDPEVLVSALRDRCFALRHPADHAYRTTAAAEVLDLARSLQRPDLALLGHEWTYAGRVGTADLPNALAALDDLEALAAIMPSPLWRYSAAVRRSGACAFLGDYEGAVDVAHATLGLGRGVVPEPEMQGLHLGMLISASLLYGRHEPDTAETVRAVAAWVDGVPVLFLNAIQAASEACVGDHERARRRLTPWLDRFHVAFHGHEALTALSASARVATICRWPEAGAPLRDLLRPFAGMMPVGNAVPVDLSVDHHLAELALLLDDVDEAVRHAGDAVTVARRMRSTPVEARALSLLARATERAGDLAAARSARDAADTLAEPLGMVLPEPPPSGAPIAPVAAVAPPPEAGPDRPATERAVALHLSGGRWTVERGGDRAHVPDSTGMRQLARLLRAPGEEVAAADLAVTGSPTSPGVVSSDLGPALDARAKREYRRRISELQSEIDEAEANHDLERATKHQLELEAILDELRAAVGLGGRDRPQGSSNEKARVNAARTIRRAIAAVAAALPDLGAHLQVSVRTGHRCSYSPEPAAALEWTVSTG